MDQRTVLGLGFTGNIDEVKVFNRILGGPEIRPAVLTSNLLPRSVIVDLVL